jgi:RNA polymerase sigma-70 factor (family 1)
VHSGKDDIQDCVLAFQRGEEQGFTYFFNELYPALLYYAFRIVRDRAIAEDVVGESFIKIWERHSQFSHPKVIKSWLYTTVRNGCLNRLLQEQRKQAREEKLARSQEGSYQESSLNEIIRAEVVREVHATIECLPTACRTIFQMLYIQGKTVREIAEELHLSISTIKNQKARGLALLRKKFPDMSMSVLVLLEVFSRF